MIQSKTISVDIAVDYDGGVVHVKKVSGMGQCKVDVDGVVLGTSEPTIMEEAQAPLFAGPGIFEWSDIATDVQAAIKTYFIDTEGTSPSSP